MDVIDPELISLRDCEPAIAAARDHWSLGDATITLIAARENHVFKVDALEAPLALRLHRPGYRIQTQIESELLWMQHLATNGCAVPRPIAAPDGTFLSTFNGISVSMVSWLDGIALSKLSVTEKHNSDLWRTLSRMHALADDWVLPDGFDRPVWDLTSEQPSWDRFWDNPLLSQEQARRFLVFRDTARNALDKLEPLDFGLIHADLIPDNVLFNGQELQLIDFDDGGFGHRLFDLATITHKCRTAQHDSLAEATIDAYNTVRFIDRQALTLFEALRACTYVGWNISRMAEPNGKERNARYIKEALMAIERFEGL